jgi:hypothetical protein
MTRHRRAAILAAACAALVLAPAAASASSIAFIKDDNVWLTSPDGAVQRQVTTDGTASVGYNWPSQADDGTILAKYGDLFVRMRPDGTRLGAPFPAMGSDIRHSGGLTVMAGPADPRISPDGTRFAYWISVRNLVTCPIFDPGCSYDDTDYTLVSHVDRFTPPEEFKAVRSYRDPSWIGNDRLLVFNYGLGVREAAISTVGAGEPALRGWFDPPAGLPQIGQGQLSRQGDKLVTLAGDEAFGPAQRQLWLYGVSGYPAEPVPACYIAQGVPPSGKFVIPSWSPDGTAVAVTESDGIHLLEHIPDLRADNPDCTAITDRLLVVGSAPGWGPSDVPGGAPHGTPPPAPQTPSQPAVHKPKRRPAARVRVRVARAGSTVRVRLLAGRKRTLVGTAVRRHVTRGRVTVRVPLNRRGRTLLAHRGRLALRARIAVAAPGGRAVATTRRLTIRA